MPAVRASGLPQCAPVPSPRQKALCGDSSALEGGGVAESFYQRLLLCKQKTKASCQSQCPPKHTAHKCAPSRKCQQSPPPYVVRATYTANKNTTLSYTENEFGGTGRGHAAQSGLNRGTNAKQTKQLSNAKREERKFSSLSQTPGR